MDDARQSVGTPAQPKDNPAQPFIFEWYENRIERDLQILYRHDLAERQKIVEIIDEMHDSNLFWKLSAAYENAVETTADPTVKAQALDAFLARIYIAGSLRGFRVLHV